MRGAAAAVLTAALAALVAPAGAAAQPAPTLQAGGTATFVVLAGADTLAVERYARTQTILAGELAGRQQGVVQSWAIELAPGGGAVRARSSVRRAGTSDTAPPLQRMLITLAGDSATLSGNGAERRIAVPPGALPFVNLSAGVIEQLLRQARAGAGAAGGAGGDAVTIPLLPFGSPQTLPATVRWTGPDSAVISLGGVELRARLGDDGALAGAEVPAQGVRFVRATGEVELTPAAPPDYSAPADAPYVAHEVTLRNEAGGVTLAGTLTVPRDAAAGARVPAVVLITGSGPQDRDSSTPALPGWAPFRQIADTLGRRGIAVLRLDDRGVGGSEAGPAGATSADLAGDVRAALQFLRASPGVDPARLALLGHSEGALIAPMVAADDPALAAVVLVAGQSRSGLVVSDSQVAQAFAERGVPAADRDSLLRLNAVARERQAAQAPWIAFWLAYDPLPAARRVRAPVLVVQGETDRQVTADQAGELAAAIREGGNGDVTVRLFPEVNHLLVHDPSGAFGGYASLPSMKVEPAVLGAVADWLAARLASGK